MAAPADIAASARSARRPRCRAPSGRRPAGRGRWPGCRCGARGCRRRCRGSSCGAADWRRSHRSAASTAHPPAVHDALAADLDHVGPGQDGEVRRVGSVARISAASLSDPPTRRLPSSVSIALVIVSGMQGIALWRKREHAQFEAMHLGKLGVERAERRRPPNRARRASRRSLTSSRSSREPRAARHAVRGTAAASARSASARPPSCRAWRARAASHDDVLARLRRCRAAARMLVEQLGEALLHARVEAVLGRLTSADEKHAAPAAAPAAPRRAGSASLSCRRRPEPAARHRKWHPERADARRPPAPVVRVGESRAPRRPCSMPSERSTPTSHRRLRRTASRCAPLPAPRSSRRGLSVRPGSLPGSHRHAVLARRSKSADRWS